MTQEEFLSGFLSYCETKHGLKLQPGPNRAAQPQTLLIAGYLASLPAPSGVAARALQPGDAMTLEMCTAGVRFRIPQHAVRSFPVGNYDIVSVTPQPADQAGKPVVKMSIRPAGAAITWPAGLYGLGSVQGWEFVGYW